VGEGRGALRDTRTAYLLLAPSLFGVGAFLVLPILVVGGLALQRWDLIGPRTFVGSTTSSRWPRTVGSRARC
jgi:ABC-type sugar transport system permease subunit